MSRVRLNQAQRRAVEHDAGPLLVLAGAGSGKTGVVTQRIARLIKRGVRPEAILAVTFTNKAAAEMAQRVKRLVGPRRCAGLLVCTFHRFGLEVIRAEGRALGLRGGHFAIVDRADCMGVVREALRRTVTGKSYDVGAILERISLAKNAFIDPQAYQQRVADSADAYDEITAQAYPRYAARLRDLQAFDFDDLVCQPVLLWRRQADALERWQRRFRYLIVDEYQDTNHAQLELLRLLATGHRNLCVVGDDDQAIYAWRGADVRNILDFEQHFPGAVVVRLERNYRSTEEVLAVANAVLAASSARRHEKKLIATRGHGDAVRLVVAPDGDSEAIFVADEIARLATSSTARPSEVAVLYRSNLQAGALEAELRARAIRYRLFGGTQTFERKEVKDLLAYLEVAVRPSNELAVRRSLTYPPRGIGDAAFGKLVAHATLHDAPLIGSVERCHAVAGLGDGAREGCRSYLRVVQAVRQQIEARTEPGAVVRSLVEAIGLEQVIRTECGQNHKAAARRLANVGHLVRSLERQGTRGAMDADRWRRALTALALRDDADDGDERGEGVTLTTMHGAKGLEFRCVFIVGLEEGLLPHARVTQERSTDAPRLDGAAPDEIEQERRLLYVAITRARERLYLCRAERRMQRGKPVKRVPSRFLLQIPEELLQPVTLADSPASGVAELGRGARSVLAAILGTTEQDAK